MGGERHGKLIVLGFAGIDKRGEAVWRCKCDCGNITQVTGYKIRSGHTTSCGCVRRNRLGNKNRTHGMSETRLYTTWLGMKARCNRPTEQNYYLYGGRGISVCDEWEKSFESFKDWALENGYTDKLTIDRKDTNGNYCPENCKWSTVYEQANNKRNNHFIDAFGLHLTVAQWSRRSGIGVATILRRVNFLGWSGQDAVSVPSRAKR